MSSKMLDINNFMHDVGNFLQAMSYMVDLALETDGQESREKIVTMEKLLHDFIKKFTTIRLVYLEEKDREIDVTHIIEELINKNITVNSWYRKGNYRNVFFLLHLSRFLQSGDSICFCSGKIVLNIKCDEYTLECFKKLKACGASLKIEDTGEERKKITFEYSV